jgi:hypothetical protein
LLLANSGWSAADDNIGDGRGHLIDDSELPDAIFCGLALPFVEE